MKMMINTSIVEDEELVSELVLLILQAEDDIKREMDARRHSFPEMEWILIKGVDILFTTRKDLNDHLDRGIYAYYHGDGYVDDTFYITLDY